MLVATMGSVLLVANFALKAPCACVEHFVTACFTMSVFFIVFGSGHSWLKRGLACRKYKQMKTYSFFVLLIPPVRPADLLGKKTDMIGLFVNISFNYSHQHCSTLSP